MLPVNETYIFSGKNGKEYIVEIDIFHTANRRMFTEGISATFRLFEIDEFAEKELVYLIDNHEPFGFHEHDELPKNRESRISLRVRNWQEAWNIFQMKCKEK